jgi:hypothetical protein
LSSVQSSSSTGTWPLRRSPRRRRHRDATKAKVRAAPPSKKLLALPRESLPSGTPHSPFSRVSH